LNQKSNLSFGVGLDIQNRLLRIGESTVRDIEDPMVNRGSTSETFFDATLGIQYHLSDKLMIGFSVPQLLEGKQRKENSFVENSRYYIGQASYLFSTTSSEKIKVQPVVLVRYSKNLPMQFDVNALLHYKNKFLVGVGYRHDYAVNFRIGVNMKDFKVRYVYDFATVNSNINSGLSHAIALGYTIKQQNSKKIETFGGEGTLYEEELPTSAEIEEILYLLIDEFFESTNRTLEEIKRVELLRESILKLLAAFNSLK
jgi:type IX secretion system PorP/SprF family membrane protein